MNVNGIPMSMGSENKMNKLSEDISCDISVHVGENGLFPKILVRYWYSLTAAAFEA